MAKPKSQQTEKQISKADDTHDENGEVAGKDPTPDVFLDVPKLTVDEIKLEVENLRAKVILQAEVLDLLKLNVGADVDLGKVNLTIKGVDAVARLEVRLDNVERIVERVMTTIDRNPEILEQITRGTGKAVEDVGGGAREAVEDVGGGAREAVEDVGGGAREAVEDVGGGAREAVEDVGDGDNPGIVEEVGKLATKVSETAGSAVRSMSRSAGKVRETAGKTAKSVGKRAKNVAKAVAESP